MRAADRVRRATRRARDARWSGVRLDHVGLVDATTLWVSDRLLPVGSRLALRGPHGSTDLGVAATTTGLAAALDLTSYAVVPGAADGLELVVLTPEGQTLPARPSALPAPGERPTRVLPVPGTGQAWRLDVRPAVRLWLAAVGPGVVARSVRAVDDGLAVLLDLPREATPVAHLVAPDRSEVPVEVELTGDGWVAGFASDALDGLDRVHVLRVATGGTELPVVRAWSDLTDPGRGVPLPMLPGPADRFVQVAWDAAGALTARIAARTSAHPEGLA